ncbi:MAG: folate-binding protein YgfZ [Thermoleophilia bacterium]
MSAADQVAAGYARLRPGGGGAAVRGRAALLWVEGPDATGFLHGLLSNDIAGLAAGESCAALLLDAKGHLGAALRVRRDDEQAYTLVVDAAAADGVAELLERYHFSEDLEILGPEQADVVTAVGADPAGAAAAADLVVGSDLPGALDLVVSDPDAAIAALGLHEAPAESLELARIAAGVPRVGRDTGPSTLVQEAGLEDVAVSFDKGCYLGQETVARAQYRGRVNRVLRGLLLADPPPAEGAPLMREGREVGRLTSVAVVPGLGAVGLAILRREAEPGSEVEVASEAGAGRARVVELPFRDR